MVDNIVNQTIEGVVTSIIYKNEENGYVVFHMIPNDKLMDICVNGTAGYIETDDIISIQGHYETHKK